MNNTENKFGKIGGSIVSAIVGMNPWDNSLGAYLKLRKEVSPAPDNIAMERGRRYEPIIADIFQGGRQEYRVEHNRLGTDEPEVLEHDEHSFLVGRPDRLLYDADNNNLVAGLEIKTTNWSNLKQWGVEGSDSIPANYLIQCQWYAGLANLPIWEVAVGFLDDSGRLRQYKEFRVNADKELFEALVERAVEFWEEHVIKGVPPQEETVDATTARWIQERFPKNINPLEIANEEEEQKIVKLIQAKQNLEKAQALYDNAENELKIAIGDRDGLQSDALGKVTWKCSKDSSRVDYRGICEELNVDKEIVSRHTKKVVGSRRFVTSGLKMDKSENNLF